MRERNAFVFLFLHLRAPSSDRLSPILLCSFGARLIPLYLISSSFSLSHFSVHLASVATASCLHGILKLWYDRCSGLVPII